MPIHFAPRIRAARVLLAVLMVGTTVTANPPVSSLPGPCPTPAPCPPPAPTCAPCQTGHAAQPRIVVNVPPPEIVYQDMPAQATCRTPSLFPRCGLFHRSCATPVQVVAPSGVPTQTVSFVPLQQQAVTGSTFAVLGGGGLNFGAANVGMAGLNVANVAPTVAVTPTFVTQSPGLQQVQVQQNQSAASAGLAAIHQAELHAASIAAGRAQQEAELRVMMSALDRARGSMAASAGAGTTGAGLASLSGAANCPELTCESFKALQAQNATISQQLLGIATKMERLQTSLTTLTQQVETLKDQQAATTKGLKDVADVQEILWDKAFPKKASGANTAPTNTAPLNTAPTNSLNTAPMNPVRVMPALTTPVPMPPAPATPLPMTPAAPKKEEAAPINPALPVIPMIPGAKTGN